jgi:hypothetical protein
VRRLPNTARTCATASGVGSNGCTDDGFDMRAEATSDAEFRDGAGGVGGNLDVAFAAQGLQLA